MPQQEHFEKLKKHLDTVQLSELCLMRFLLQIFESIESYIVLSSLLASMRVSHNILRKSLGCKASAANRHSKEDVPSSLPVSRKPKKWWCCSLLYVKDLGAMTSSRQFGYIDLVVCLLVVPQCLLVHLKPGDSHTGQQATLGTTYGARKLWRRHFVEVVCLDMAASVPHGGGRHPVPSPLAPRQARFACATLIDFRLSLFCIPDQTSLS